MAEWCYMFVENFQEERVLIEHLKVFLPLEPHKESVCEVSTAFITNATCESKTESIKIVFFVFNL